MRIASYFSQKLKEQFSFKCRISKHKLFDEILYVKKGNNPSKMVRSNMQSLIIISYKMLEDLHLYLTLSIWIKVTNNSYSLDKKKSLSYIHFNQENMSCLQKRCKSSNILYEIIIKDCIFDRTIFDGLLPFLTYSIIDFFLI
jgi:hypothetical protein